MHPAVLCRMVGKEGEKVVKVFKETYCRWIFLDNEKILI